MRVPTRIPSTAQLRSLEQAYIEACHPDWGLVLMELAGRRAAEVALSMFEQSPGPVAIICGRGNNGGDGFVVARYLHLSGIPVLVSMVGPPPDEPAAGARRESHVNREILKKIGLTVNHIGPGDSDAIREQVGSAGLVVDALLGTGTDRPVEGFYASLIATINDSGRPVLAVDLPSGVNSDSGQVMGAAVRADATVTFGYLKAGLLCHPGAALCGQIHFADIGLPSLDSGMAPAGGADWWLGSAAFVRANLPDRPADSHKGTYGHVLTIAGSRGMSGAALMAARSALRAGAGLSILATPASLLPGLPPQEVIYRAMAEGPAGGLAPAAAQALEAEIERATAVVLGPGIGQDGGTFELVQGLCGKIKLPCLIDADGLNAIAAKPGCWPEAAGNFVITPHPKELSRLAGQPAAAIQADRIGSAVAAAERFGCTVVLKGAGTVIASPEGKVYVNPTGNAGMATAGSGDVLSGIIGGLMAQGVPPFAAAVAGAYVHGAAGDAAAQEIGPAGTIAGDFISFIPAVCAKIRAGEYAGSSLELSLLAARR